MLNYNAGVDGIKAGRDSEAGAMYRNRGGHVPVSDASVRVRGGPGPVQAGV